MPEPIFTDFRRELVAKTLFDLLKIAVAAAFASKFFFEFSSIVKAGAVAIMVLLALSGFFFCPKKPVRG